MEINPRLFEECTVKFKLNRQQCVLFHHLTSNELIISSIDREKAKHKIREDKWQRVRDAAIKNADASNPLPSSLLQSVAPLGTYKPDDGLDSLTLEDIPNGFSDDERDLSGMGGGGGSVAGEDGMEEGHAGMQSSDFNDLEGGNYSGSMEDEDDHAELVSLSPLLSRRYEEY